MPKVKGQPKTNHNPGWKARRQAIRRAAAEARQAAHDALSPEKKLERAGNRQRLRLMLIGDVA